MAHSYEEIRTAAIDILAKREKVQYPPDQFKVLLLGVGEVLKRRSSADSTPRRTNVIEMNSDRSGLDEDDRDVFLEVFWDLFRQGVITIGLNEANPQFPFFRLSSLGKRLIAHQQVYFFHDVSSYEALIRNEVPAIDDVTLVYLKEAMQSFRVGCILSTSVMLGVATEHTFNLLMEKIEGSSAHATRFQSVNRERGILHRVNKFKNILDAHLSSLTPAIREDLDTHFAGILSIIRDFRNQSGHPTGKIIGREQAYVLLQLFVPYCKKMYQLMDHHS